MLGHQLAAKERASVKHHNLVGSENLKFSIQTTYANVAIFGFINDNN